MSENQATATHRRSIYALLNKHTKSWWYHKQLRERGEAVEARKRERQSILDTVRTLRAALASPGGYAHVGRGGWSVHYAGAGMTGSLQHYGGMEQPTIQCCLRLGLPIVNTLDCDIDVAYAACKLPMVAVDGKADSPAAEPGKKPWHGMNYAPRAYVFAEYVRIGALIYNWEPDNSES